MPLTEPGALCSDAQPTRCRPASHVEVDLRRGALEILQTSATPGGMQGAQVLTVRVGPRVLRAKWRSESSADIINEPRKELAAYAVDKLIGSTRRPVVPPTAARCFPLAEYRRMVDGHASPRVNADCVFGYLSYWVPGGTEVEEAREEELLHGGDGLIDEQRVRTDPVYRTALGSLNLLTYAIRHGDAHAKQFLLVPGIEGVTVMSVDNSVAFQSLKNPAMLWRRDWSLWHLPDIQATQVQHLRALSGRDYERLRVIQQLEKRDGVWIDSWIEAPFGDLNDGVREDGDRLQVGLTDGEVRLVKERVTSLLGRVERGEIVVASPG